MAKISLRVFKKGKPIFWIIGAVLIFVIFYLLFNKGASSAPAKSGGGMTVVNSGPSEALQIASMQAGAQTQALQMQGAVEAARIQATRDQAALASQVALAQLGSGEKIALATLDADRFAAGLNAQTNLLINEQNLSYNLESARVAGETQLNLRALDVGVMTRQMDTQAAMFAKQLDANQAMYRVQAETLITQNLISQVSSLKSKDRDTALAAILAVNSGSGFSGGKGDDYIYIPSPAPRLM